MDIKKESILQALENKKGIVTEACNSIGFARSTFYKWYNEDAEFKAAVDDIQDVAIDYVEGKLFEKITGVTVKSGHDRDGNDIVYDVPPSDTAIIFYLKTKGKKRGYIERQEMTGADGKDLGSVHFYIPENGRNKDNSTTEGLPGEGS
jgi:hypothetical protein